MTNPPKFKFKNWDSDLKLALEEIDRQTAASGAQPKAPTGDSKAGLAMTLARYRKGVDMLFKAYLENNTLDPILKHFTKDFDGSGGNEYFVPMSDRLVQQKDSARVIAMWKAVVTNRRKAGLDSETKEAFQRLLDALSAMGDRENFKLIEADSEYLLTGKGKSKSVGQESANRSNRRGMSEDAFWELIERAKSEAPSPGERSAVLQDLLGGYSEAENEEFRKIFGAKFALAYRWDVWGVAYIARGGCGDDEFEYVRAWLISEGKSVYDRVLDDPESLAEFIGDDADAQAEEFVGFADQSQRPSEPKGRQWKEEDLPKLFPRAWAKTAT